MRRGRRRCSRGSDRGDGSRSPCLLLANVSSSSVGVVVTASPSVRAGCIATSGLVQSSSCRPHVRRVRGAHDDSVSASEHEPREFGGARFTVIPVGDPILPGPGGRVEKRDGAHDDRCAASDRGRPTPPPRGASWPKARSGTTRVDAERSSVRAPATRSSRHGTRRTAHDEGPTEGNNGSVAPSMVPAPTLRNTTSLPYNPGDEVTTSRARTGARHGPPQWSSSWPPPETTSASTCRISRKAIRQWTTSRTTRFASAKGATRGLGDLARDVRPALTSAGARPEPP